MKEKNGVTFRVIITLDDGKICTGTGYAENENDACLKAELALICRYSNIKIIKSEARRA